MTEVAPAQNPSSVQEAGSSPQSSQPKKNLPVGGLLLLAFAFLFVIGASVWIVTGNTAKTKQTQSVTPPPTPSLTQAPKLTVTQAPVVVPPPSAEQLVFISGELRSGDKSKVAAVMDIDPQQLTAATVTDFAAYKSLVFDAKTFLPSSDGKTASVAANITFTDERQYIGTFVFVVKDGKWVIRKEK